MPVLTAGNIVRLLRATSRCAANEREPMSQSFDEMVWTRPASPRAALLLAHGAGAAMTSPFMDAMAERLAARAIAVARFEFAYMAARRRGGAKTPPPRADRLVGEFLRRIASAAAEAGGLPLLIGGKSLGGRVAAMAAADSQVAQRAVAVVCLGYPFHAPGNASDLRLDPLRAARLPVLICQGDRDPFGSAAEIAGWQLPATITVTYLADGDHDFKPRGRSPATWKGNLDAAADAVAAFAVEVAGR